jgi:heat shock protein HslJ
MPYPQRTTLHLKSGSLHGCGGDPQRLLQGVKWRVTDTGANAVTASSAPHVQFFIDGKITGSTGCNRFFAQYTVTGETLSFKDIGSTRMACPAPLMAEEEAFMTTLSSVNRFSFDASDTQRLILHTAEPGVRIEARAM